MPDFKGFPTQSRLVRIPEPFFQEAMPFIDDIDELRVSLYTLWYLERLEQPVKFLYKSDYLRDKIFMQSLGGDAENHLTRGLNQAMARGVLIGLDVIISDKPDTLIMANTLRSRTTLEAIKSGKINPEQLADYPAQVDILRPNVFELYEQNIGALTPMMAEILKSAEVVYPAAWIEEAMELAVLNNSRRWRYVEGILRKWKENGRDGEY